LCTSFNQRRRRGEERREVGFASHLRDRKLSVSLCVSCAASQAKVLPFKTHISCTYYCRYCKSEDAVLQTARLSKVLEPFGWVYSLEFFL
jgi:hypothetical protein